MRWFSISVDAEEPIHVAASDLVGAVIWVWDNVSTDAKSITIYELAEENSIARRN